MSRLIYFVIALSYYEARKESKNCKMKNSHPHKSTASRLLDGRLTNSTKKPLCKNLLVNYIHVYMYTHCTTTLLGKIR